MSVGCAERERHTLVDTLRAIVLAAVVCVNMMTIAGLAYMTPELRASSLGPIDLAAWDLMSVFFEGKALAAFSFMFGLSFSLIMQRAAQADLSAALLFLRRLAVLGLIGLFNAVFLFWADILMSYAALGLILPLAARFSARALLWLSGTLMLAGPAVLVLAGMEPPQPVPEGHVSNLEAYASPSYVDAVTQNWHMVLNAAEGADSMLVLRFFILSGLFLLGLAVGKSGGLRRLPDYRDRLLSGGGALLVAGILLEVIPEASPSAALKYLNTPVMALGYLMLLAYALQAPAAVWVHKALAPLGRMSLTGYLMSAVLGQAVFYGWGLQLIGRLGTVPVAVVAVGIFAVMAGFAHLWFRHFLYGPWEWAWRSLTRMEVQPLLGARLGG